jgi:hypothetical protein
LSFSRERFCARIGDGSHPDKLFANLDPHQSAFGSTAQVAVIIIALARGAIMAQQTKPNEDPKQKRVIEFDMFVRDLEPSEEQRVRGGGGSPKNPSENEDAAK